MILTQSVSVCINGWNLEALIEDVDTEKIEPLPEYYFDPTAMINEPVVEEGNGDKREMWLGEMCTVHAWP